ncbi:MAG: hypothetical protein KDD61_04575 [Bdellovibrionales bacterium]|nr:hypothetical protein [Bdellovibrionales bacterium]
MKNYFVFLLTLISCISISASAREVRGFNLIEDAGFFYDANLKATKIHEKTQAQVTVDRAKLLGANHIILNPRATMLGPYSNDVRPLTKGIQVSKEYRSYLRLIEYIRSIGMTVGIRPILFVVNKEGKTPYIEKRTDGSEKIWWHGNIQPSDPNAWFESFRLYIEMYLRIAKKAQIEEFTIGAELYSMTVGIEDQWLAHPHGFPLQWEKIVDLVRGSLPKARIMYDINFTDDSNVSGGLGNTGGELERWRYRLVDLGPPLDPGDRIRWEQDPNGKPIWDHLVRFWKKLDAVGIDMYRSLASESDEIPDNYRQLVSLLSSRSDRYALQLELALAEIEDSLGEAKPVMFKEIGYKSVEKGFIDPFSYEKQTTDVNLEHQAAAYEAFFKSFWEPEWTWFYGVSFWDISTSLSRSGELDAGFSPLGKPLTENVIKKYYLSQ